MQPSGPNCAPSIRDIQIATCCALRVTMNDLRGVSRRRNVSWPRQIAMALCRELTTASTTKVGRHFGGRDHTTVINAISVDRQRSRENAKWAVWRGLVLAALPAATDARIAQGALTRESFSAGLVGAAGGSAMFDFDDPYVTVDCTIRGLTDRAVKIEDEHGTVVWLPRSCLHGGCDSALKGAIGDAAQLKVRRWYAEKNALA